MRDGRRHRSGNASPTSAARADPGMELLRKISRGTACACNKRGAHVLSYRNEFREARGRRRADPPPLLGWSAEMNDNVLILTLLGIVVGVLVLVGLYTCAFEEAQRDKRHRPED
jgi:hypothetical protein